MIPSTRDILFGVVATMAGVGALLMLKMLLGNELLTYVSWAALFGLMVYMIALLSAIRRSRKRKTE